MRKWGGQIVKKNIVVQMFNSTKNRLGKLKGDCEEGACISRVDPSTWTVKKKKGVNEGKGKGGSEREKDRQRGLE